MTHINETLEAIADGAAEVQGAVTVEIKDERGKTVDYEKKPNFISKAWKAYARALLRRQWMAYGFNPSFSGGMTGNAQGGSTGLLWQSGRGSLPIWPHRNLICWNQTTAEDSANEISPAFTLDGIVAWASKYPFGSASGTRGNVNSTESTVTDFQVRHVYDWLTSQGNGTFQSVGYVDLAGVGVGNTAIPKMHVGGFRRRFVATTIATPSGIITGATSLNAGGGWLDPATGRFYFLVRRYAPGGHQGFRVCSVDMSGLDDSLDNGLMTAADVSGLAITSETQEFTLSVASSSYYNNTHSVLGKDGSNFIIAYVSTDAINSGYVQIGKVASTGAATVAYANQTLVGGAATGAVLGGYIYISSPYNNGFRMNKHNASTLAFVSGWNLDATAIAFCTAAGYSTPQVHNVTTDGTDLYCTVGALGGGGSNVNLMFKISLTGVTLEYLGMGFDYNGSSTTTEAAATPFFYTGTGQYGYPRNQIWNPEQSWGDISWQNPGSQSSDPMSSPAYSAGDSGLIYGAGMFGSPGAHQMVWYDGALHYMRMWDAGNQGTNQFGWCLYRRGYDLGSRVLLASPKVKLNTQTMKITYDITLPAWT